MFSIKGINLADKGFYVNLDSSTDRRELVEAQIKKFEITDLERFSALTDPLHQSSATKSQRAVFERALQNNLETIFVAEDDFFIPDQTPFYANFFQKTFEEHLKDVSQDIKTIDWDVYLFGCVPRTHLVPFTRNSALVDRSTGAWAYLIKKNAYKFILDNFSYTRDYQAIDNILPLLNFNNFKVFTAVPLLIHHSKGLVSTLQPNLGPVDYSNLIEGYYGKFLIDPLTCNDDYVAKYSVERDITIVFLDLMYDGFVDIMRKCLFNLPKSISKCRILLYYTDSRDHKTQELISYFRDRPDFYNVHIELFNNRDEALRRVCNVVRTPYALIINPEYIFTDANINFNDILYTVKQENIDNLIFNYDINSIDFNLDFNNLQSVTEIPDYINLVNLEFLRKSIDITPSFFNCINNLGKIINNLNFRIGHQTNNANKTVAEEKTQQYILNNPFIDY